MSYDYDQRLRNILISDKHFSEEKAKQIIKSDIYNVLRNFADVSIDDIFFDIILDDMGEYELKFVAKCKRLKMFGSIID